MHYHLEIIMPPVDDVEKAVEQIMAPFDENQPDDSEHFGKNSFWDYYSIGGRFGGSHLQSRYSAEAIEGCEREMNEVGVKVKGIQFGRPELAGSESKRKAMEVWSRHFPSEPECWFFTNGQRDLDVCKLSEVGEHLTAFHLIIASPDWADDSALSAREMTSQSIWNGVSIVDTSFDGFVMKFLAGMEEKKSKATDEWKAKHLPTQDWLAVTVDYHS